MKTIQLIVVLWCLIFKMEIYAQCVKDGTINEVSNFSKEGQINLQISPILDYLKIKTNVKFYDDYVSPNAFARCGCDYPDCHGIIRMGVNFAQIEYSNFGTIGLYGVVAHEAAHVLQCRKGDIFNGMFKELHADFIAGWVLAKLGKLNNEGKISALGESLWDKGDFILSHGTPNQRRTAVLLGVDAAESEDSINDVYYNVRDWFESYLPSRGPIKFKPKSATCSINKDSLLLKTTVQTRDSTIAVSNHFIFGNFSLKMQKDNPYVYKATIMNYGPAKKANVIEVFVTNDKYLLVCTNSEYVEKWYYLEK